MKSKKSYSGQSGSFQSLLLRGRTIESIIGKFNPYVGPEEKMENWYRTNFPNIRQALVANDDQFVFHDDGTTPVVLEFEFNATNVAPPFLNFTTHPSAVFSIPDEPIITVPIIPGKTQSVFIFTQVSARAPPSASYFDGWTHEPASIPVGGLATRFLIFPYGAGNDTNALDYTVNTFLDPTEPTFTWFNTFRLRFRIP